MLPRLSEKFKVGFDVKRPVSREKGFAHVILLAVLVVAFLIGFGVLVGYAIWGK